MKSVNFIGTISPKTRSAVHRWAATSLVALLATCIILLMLYIRAHYQYQTLWATCQKLHGSKNQMLTFLQSKRLLKEQESSLQQQVSKITGAHEKQKKITSLIELVAQPDNRSVMLHSLDVKKNKVTMTVQAHTSNDIVAYVAQLEQHTLFTHVMLQELTTHNGGVQATIHATIV